MYTYIYIHTHIYIYTHTHARTHTHAHTRTHDEPSRLYDEPWGEGEEEEEGEEKISPVPFSMAQAEINPLGDRGGTLLCSK